MTSDDDEKSKEIPEGQARDSWGNQVWFSPWGYSARKYWETNAVNTQDNVPDLV